MSGINITEIQTIDVLKFRGLYRALTKEEEWRKPGWEQYLLGLEVAGRMLGVPVRDKKDRLL